MIDIDGGVENTGNRFQAATLPGRQIHGVVSDRHWTSSDWHTGRYLKWSGFQL